jgi:hypothetical protein
MTPLPNQTILCAAVACSRRSKIRLLNGFVRKRASYGTGSEMRRLAVAIAFLSCFTCSSRSDGQTISMDLQQTDQQVLGFGAQIWAGDTRGHAALAEIGARYARLQHSVNFFTFPTQPPTDSNLVTDDNFTAMKNYIAANFNGPGGSESWHLPGVKKTQNWANANGVELILNELQIAYSFLNATNTQMLTSRVDDYATFWGAMLSYLADNNVRPAYIELANEPNGTWNGRITSTDYNTLVTQTRSVLDAHGFSDVDILGPGLSLLGDSSWTNALDSAGVNSLAGWSTHAWDDWQGIDARAQIFENAVDAKDPNKPIFITEYATAITNFNGTSYGAPESGGNAADQPVFAVQVFNNTLALVNHGAGALILWEAADQSWSGKRWGLKRLNGTNRPAVDAMKPLLDLLPDNATALEQIWSDPEITAAGFIKDGKLIVGLANTLDRSEFRTLDFANVPGILQFDQGSQYNEGVVSPVFYSVTNNSVSFLLSAESNQTLAFDILTPVAGDFDLSGTVDDSDLSLWEAGYGMSSGAGIGDGDGDNDGDVDGRDFLLWQQYAGISSSLQAVTLTAPEPAAIWLMTIMILLCAAWCHLKSSGGHGTRTRNS